jgi:hypothetical protein
LIFRAGINYEEEKGTFLKEAGRTGSKYTRESYERSIVDKGI